MVDFIENFLGWCHAVLAYQQSLTGSVLCSAVIIIVYIYHEALCWLLHGEFVYLFIHSSVPFICQLNKIAHIAVHQFEAVLGKSLHVYAYINIYIYVCSSNTDKSIISFPWKCQICLSRLDCSWSWTVPEAGAVQNPGRRDRWWVRHPIAAPWMQQCPSMTHVAIITFPSAAYCLPWCLFHRAEAKAKAFSLLAPAKVPPGRR